MDTPADIERRIADALARGELREAATAAIEGYGAVIYAYVRAVLRDEQDASEAFGQWSEDLWRGIGEFRGDAAFRTWAYRVAYFAALRFARDPYRTRGRRLETSEASRLAASVRSRSASLVERQQDAAGRLREGLSREEQTLLILRIDQKLSWREVAQVMTADGQPIEEAAARKRFERLKERLRKLAREQGLLGE
jgi:RNA polymerase sigma-70 factor, ECF subfamily